MTFGIIPSFADPKEILSLMVGAQEFVVHVPTSHYNMEELWFLFRRSVQDMWQNEESHFALQVLTMADVTLSKTRVLCSGGEFRTCGIRNSP